MPNINNKSRQNKLLSFNKNKSNSEQPKSVDKSVVFKSRFNYNENSKPALKILKSLKNNNWIDNSINNSECKKYYNTIQLSLRYGDKRLYFFKKNFVKFRDFRVYNSFFNTQNLINFYKNNKQEIFNKDSFYSAVVSNKNNHHPAPLYYSRNTNVVNTEFYHLWFYKATLGGLFNKSILFNKTAEGWGGEFWKIFRKARYDAYARKLRNMLRLNWTKALYCKTIATLGPHRFKLLKNLKIKCLRRLKKARYYRELSTTIFKNGLRIRMLFGKNYTKKKYAPHRRHWKFSKKLSRLYFLAAKQSTLYYKLLKKKYFKHVKQYSFIQHPSRLISYFNILTAVGNTSRATNLAAFPSWLNYFNLTKRKAKTLFDLLRKRQWSAEHNINPESQDLYKTLRSLPVKFLTNRRLNIFDYVQVEDILIRDYKPIVIYKKFSNEVTQSYFKSRLNNKFFVRSRNAKRAIYKLNQRLKKLKFDLIKTQPLLVTNFLNFFLKQETNLFKKSCLPLLTMFKYKCNTIGLASTPTVLYSAPLHLRFFRKNNYFGLIINITQKNYFFTLVKANNGEVQKIFSSGYSRAKTTRLRRSPIMFTKVFNLLIDYLKSKNISKLKFVRIVQPSLVPKNISFEDQKKINWYPNQFKHAKIRVRRWIYELKRVHGLALRGPKLRRK